MILRGLRGVESVNFDGAVDIGGTVVSELRGGGDSKSPEDVDGTDDKDLITVDKLYKEAEVLPRGEGTGNKRKLRTGRDSTPGFDRELGNS